MEAIIGSPRALAVLWQDFQRWDVLSTWMEAGFAVTHPLRPLSEVMQVRWCSATDDQIADGTVSMVDKVSFEGDIFAGKKQETKMEQFVALPGDVIVSKIRARQGSVGLVQPKHGLVSVTIHYRVLTPDTRALDAHYAWLALRSSYCRAQFLAATGGAMKGEISEDALLAVKIPLPALAEQEAIVARWHKAQDGIAAARKRIRRLEAKLPYIVYGELGTPPSLDGEGGEKCLVVSWKDLGKWSFNYLSRAIQGLVGFTRSKFPIEPLGKHLAGTMNGYCIKPVQEPTPHKMLKLNALQPDGLDLAASKFIKIPDTIAERFSIHKDDLFICRSVGSYEHVAKCALAKEDAPNVVFPDTMIRARFKDSLVSEYVGEVLQTPLGRSFFQSNARTTVGMWKIGAEDIEGFPIPVPPSRVQQRVIQRMAAARTEIAREREAADRLTKEIDAEVEALILGSKNLDGGTACRKARAI